MQYNLKMVQGNTQNFSVQNDDRNFEIGDKVTFSVKKSYSDDEYLLKKEVTSFLANLAVIEILPNDTAKILPGAYVYDVQLNSFDGIVKTICKGDFILDWRVTDG